MGRENETALLTKSMKFGNLKLDSEFINERKEGTCQIIVKIMSYIAKTVFSPLFYPKHHYMGAVPHTIPFTKLFHF